jgi:two-component system response regulator HydG
MESHALRVLVVDDQIDMAEMVADRLREQGYATHAVHSGSEAIDWLRRERFDAVVTDLRMPGIDGLQVLEASRALDPSRPVIIMTAHGAFESALDASGRGAYHYITKPFRMDELAHALAHAFGTPPESSTVRRLREK